MRDGNFTDTYEDEGRFVIRRWSESDAIGIRVATMEVFKAPKRNNLMTRHNMCEMVERKKRAGLDAMRPDEEVEERLAAIPDLEGLHALQREWICRPWI